MQCPIKNPANYDLSDLESHVHGMYDHFASKYGFDKHPTMVFDSDEDNKAEILGKTAYYDPQSFEIHVFVDGRHSKDILRSIAHELIHHKQNLEGRLDVGGYSGPGYYLENDKLKEVEHEAMLEGNATMREYEDTVKYTETKNMSLKEWKNNELNQLLMKKFGILKESVNEEVVEEIAEGAECPKCEAEKCECEEVNESQREPLEELSGNLEQAKAGGRVQDGEIEGREQGRLREEEQLEEAEVEETVRRVDSQNYPGNRAGQGTPEQDRKNMREEQLDEYSYEQQYADEAGYEMPRGKPQPAPEPKELSAVEKQKKSGRWTMDKASVPRQFRENKAQELKEAITKIANAKRIFLNNKRIK